MESQAQLPFDGVFEYLPPLSGYAVNQDGVFLFVFRQSDVDSAAATAISGTYTVSADTVKNLIQYHTDPAQAGTNFSWLYEMNGDTLTYRVLDESGEVTSTGRTVLVRQR